MKKNSINTFSKGLTFDLNPLVTPNDTLTDCVNGTFITLNGDELSLQNDAGNTTIPYDLVETTTTTVVTIVNPAEPDQVIEVPIQVLWTTNSSETVSEDFIWNNLQYTSNIETILVNNINIGYNYLYISIPKNSKILIKNALGIVMYDNNYPDQGQLFNYIGEFTTPSGAKNDIYRKNDVYNTSQQVYFYITVTEPENIENIIVVPGEGETTETVTVTNTEFVADKVKLSDGFYPIGIKEYGGVLYIISKNTPNIEVKEWGINDSYNYGDFVYSSLITKTFYKKIDTLTTNSPLPIKTNIYWEVIGSEEDFNNYISKVEIGTYPSPEFSGNTEHSGNEIELNSNNDLINDFLYKPFIINDSLFKSGTYAMFSSLVTDSENISSFKWIEETESFTYLPKFYKIKLYHQLTNGYLDITDDIWAKYIEYKGRSITNSYWFSDEEFIYYCPTQYKGKLAISVEIEGIQEFVVSNSSITNNESNYIFNLSVSAKGSQYISITKMRVELWIDNTKQSFDNDDYTLIDIVNDVGTFSIDTLPLSLKNSILKYRITPIISINGLDEFGINELPKEYIDSLTIYGNKLVSSNYEDIKFSSNNTTYQCSPTGTKTYLEVSIQDSNSGNITNTLEPTVLPYVFLHEDRSGVPITSGATVIAEYTVVDSRPVITNIILPIDNFIKVLFEQFNITEFSEQTLIDCGIVGSFTPDFVGVTQVGWIVLSKTDGSFRSPTSLGISSAQYSYKTCVYYSKEDKLLFIGGNNGLLHIYDISNTDAIQSKSIKVFNNTDSISCISVLTDQTSKKILIGRANGCNGYYQDYYSNFSQYVNLETTELGQFWNGTGQLRSFLYYDGYYFASTKNGEVFKVASLTSTWTEIDDLHDDYLKIVETNTKIWIPEVEDDLIYIDKSNLNQLHRWGLSGAKRQAVRQLIPLSGDNLIAVCSDLNECIWVVLSPSSSLNITPNGISSCSSGFYDGVKYTYLSVRDSNGIFWIGKYNSDLLSWEEFLPSPLPQEQLFIY